MDFVSWLAADEGSDFALLKEYAKRNINSWSAVADVQSGLLLVAQDPFVASLRQDLRAQLFSAFLAFDSARAAETKVAAQTALAVAKDMASDTLKKAQEAEVRAQYTADESNNANAELLAADAQVKAAQERSEQVEQDHARRISEREAADQAAEAAKGTGEEEARTSEATAAATAVVEGEKAIASAKEATKLAEDKRTAAEQDAEAKRTASVTAATAAAAAKGVAESAQVDAQAAEKALALAIDAAARAEAVSSDGAAPPSIPPAAPATKGDRKRQFVSDNATALLVGSLVILLFVVFLFALWPGGLLESLSDIPTARGLITFIFAFGLIFVALFLLIALFVDRDDDVNEKFSSAKEIFTALIAVLGTIMGFYFGIEQVQENERLPATEEVALLRMARMGIGVTGLDLSDAQIPQIVAILDDADKSEEQKQSDVDNILNPPTADSVIAGSARLGVLISNLELGVDRVNELDAILDSSAGAQAKKAQIEALLKDWQG